MTLPPHLKALFGALAVLQAIPGLASAEPPPAAVAKPYSTLSSEAFMSRPGTALLIDVREPEEWTQTGVPRGAALAPISRTDFVENVLASVGGDRTRPVALICRSGTRSMKAADVLAAAGFTNVTNVGDGMIGREGVGAGWLASRLPVIAYTPAQ
ncbi:MAG: rhodanese-like domain-containing protein [Alphaproteobacteria bacterium]|nr:rhodanese-like domain-containing protein [Alphaproteobacteria bacterium]